MHLSNPRSTAQWFRGSLMNSSKPMDFILSNVFRVWLRSARYRAVSYTHLDVYKRQPQTRHEDFTEVCDDQTEL